VFQKHDYSLKKSRRKALCVSTLCHGRGTTYQGSILALHDEPALSDVPKIGGTTSGNCLTMWDKFSVQYPFTIKERVNIDFIIGSDIPAFLARGECPDGQLVQINT
jgi:hypothetical protein